MATLAALVQEQFERTSQSRPERMAPGPAERSLPGVQAADEFFEKLIDLIGLIKDEYLSPYTHILDSYQKFFAAFTSKITSDMQWWIGSAEEGKKVTIDGAVFHQKFDELIREFTLPNSAAVLFPEPGRPAASQQEAEKWQAALGLPASSVKRLSTGGYGVVMDLSPIDVLKAGTPNFHDTWDTARFQAWQSGFNAQEERMKNQLQSFTQKFSNANSYHDNFNKTLSSHLSQFADMLKHMTTL
ncbi:IpaD/SipD/SspD family type III secretion system needle tip protein [Pseudomonas sp. BJa5]|uniref:IpaD/SipD/SspD family type III secretion system needle tip protein n=1 Tax=Pseudomonas sp. BJa5 TaxID=2936270 RepID=UPI00255A1C9E|nr:IpaD/SipD/SspD family type III secretion system needle tip protein [Pseudomonas sp. BGr12]MDL2421181.1 IpaD/SipD/SspD family type III secretion system needle tip protein [Pseudomonas sp. BGr12]